MQEIPYEVLKYIYGDEGISELERQKEERQKFFDHIWGKQTKELYHIVGYGDTAIIYQDNLCIGEADMDTIGHAITWAIQQKQLQESQAQARSLVYNLSFDGSSFKDGLQHAAEQLEELSRKAVQSMEQARYEALCKFGLSIPIEPGTTLDELRSSVEMLAGAGKMTDLGDYFKGWNDRDDYFDHIDYLRYKSCSINTRGYAQGKYHRSRDRLR